MAAVGLVLHSRRQSHDERRAWWKQLKRVVLVSAIVGVVLWLPTIWGTVVVDDGNLGVIGHFFRTRSKTSGLGSAVKVLGLQWGPRPEWIFGPRGIGIIGSAGLESRWWVAVWLLLAGAATAVAVVRRASDTVWLAVTVGAGLVAALVASSSIVGIVFPYLIRWTWVFGAALGILVLRGLWLAIPPEHRAGALRIVVPVAAAALAVLCVMETVDALDAGTPFATRQVREKKIDDEVLAALPPGPGTVLIDARRGFVPTGLALALARHGIPVEITPENDVFYGPERHPHRGPHRARLIATFGSLGKVHGRRIAHYVAPRLPGSRAAFKRFLEHVKATTPPGPERDALLAQAREQGNLPGPRDEISVYLVTPR